MKQKKADEVLISIIVPVFNTSKYLVKCLESIRLAMFENCEVIIINDGSTDDSEKIVKDYIKSLPKEIINQFKYIFKKNAGLADTKNVGISKSKGKYINRKGLKALNPKIAKNSYTAIYLCVLCYILAYFEVKKFF